MQIIYENMEEFQELMEELFIDEVNWAMTLATTKDSLTEGGN